MNSKRQIFFALATGVPIFLTGLTAFANELEISQALAKLHGSYPREHLDGRNLLKALSPTDKRLAAARLLLELKSPNEGVRSNAVHGLGALGPVSEQVIPALFKAFKEDPRIDSSALIALEAAGPASAQVLVSELGNRASNWRFAIARSLDNLAPLPQDTVPVLVEVLRASDFGDEGHIASAIAKTDPSRSDVIPLMLKAYHQAGVLEDTNRERISSALDRMTTPDAKSAVRVLRWQRRGWILLVSGPLALLCVWLMWRFALRFYRAQTAMKFVLTPFIFIALLIALLPFFATAHGVVTGTGPYLTALSYLLSGSVMAPLLALPVISALTFFTWAFISFSPLISKTQALGRGRIVIGSISSLAFLGILWMIISTGHYILPVGP